MSVDLPPNFRGNSSTSTTSASAGGRDISSGKNSQTDTTSHTRSSDPRTTAPRTTDTRNADTRNSDARSTDNSNTRTQTDAKTQTTSESKATNSTTRDSNANQIPNKSLSAVVVQVIKTTAKIYDITINLNGKFLVVKSPVELQPGEQLKLEATKNGNLKLIEVTPLKQQSLINNAIRTLISQQNSYQLLLSKLLTLSTKNTGTTTLLNTMPSYKGLSPNILQSVNKLMASLPQSKDFQQTKTLQNPNQLKLSLSNSGLQLENKLSNMIMSLRASSAGSSSASNSSASNFSSQNMPSTQQMVQKDFKANLLRLMSNLLPTTNQSEGKTRTTPPQTLQQISALLATTTGSLSGTKSSQMADLQKALSTELAKTNTQISSYVETVTKPPLMGSFFLQPQQTAKADTKQKSWMDSIVSTLAKLTLSTLARVQLHQLASLPQTQEGQTTQLLSLELPIVHEDKVHLFQIQIGEEETQQTQEKEKEKCWKINLAFDIEPLGPMHIQLTMVGQSASATIWAEQKETVDFTHSHLDVLTDSLQHIGLSVKQIDCLKGKPPEKKATFQQHLVDINT